MANVRSFEEVKPTQNALIVMIDHIQDSMYVGTYTSHIRTSNGRVVNDYTLSGVLGNGQLYKIDSMDPVQLSLSSMKRDPIIPKYTSWYYVSEDPHLHHAVNTHKKAEIDSMVKYYHKQTSRKKRSKLFTKIDPRARLKISRAGLAKVRNTLGDDIASHVTSFITGSSRKRQKSRN